MGCLSIRSLVLSLAMVGLLFSSLPVWAQGVLEIPADGGHYSGIGMISGWKCEADGLAISIDGGAWIPLLHGAQRLDTQSVCGDTNNGFVSIFNWGIVGDGEHTAVLYDNGVEVARSTFTVATLGEEFVRGAEGECTIRAFPAPGETAQFRWNQSTQHLELVGEDPPPVADHGDTRGTAIRLDTILSDASSTSRTQDGQLEGGGDVDYFRLALHRAGTIVVETTGSVDTVGELEDDDGQRLTSNDNAGDRSNFRISRAMSAGVYYINLSSG